MKLYLVKPDLTYYEQYNEMMAEWYESKTHIAPWFLNSPVKSPEEFESLIRLLDNCEHGIVDKQFASTTSYFVVDESGKLIGATSLRHYLTVAGLNTWGHIGYGVRPCERKKGYATQMLKMMLEEAKQKKIYKVLVGAYEGNVGSCKTIEKCGGQFENCVYMENEEEAIRRYWFDLL